MANQLTKSIPVGDLQLYDNYVPALAAGTWRIEVTHTLSGVETGDLSAKQKFVVSAPQFSFDSSGILNRYPPDGTTGSYGQVLPHIVLKDALLPWERRISGSPNVQPWLAVLVLQENELLGGKDSPTRSQTTNVADFLKPNGSTLKPAVQKEDDVADTDPCAFIRSRHLPCFIPDPAARGAALSRPLPPIEHRRQGGTGSPAERLVRRGRGQSLSCRTCFRRRHRAAQEHRPSGFVGGSGSLSGRPARLWQAHFGRAGQSGELDLPDSAGSPAGFSRIHGAHCQPGVRRRRPLSAIEPLVAASHSESCHRYSHAIRSRSASARPRWLRPHAV